MSLPDVRDRIRGGILGTLVGDALGVPVEFMGRSRLDQDPVTDMRSFGTWNQPAGTWSDDGAMSLTTVDVLTKHGWAPKHMAEGFRRWLDEGWWAAHGAAFDVGNTTRNAIMRFRIHGDWTESGDVDERSNGNGSLMRCLPISAWLAGASAHERIARASEASALTHAHPRSRLCCAWHALWCEAALAVSDPQTCAQMASARLRREVPESERSHLARIIDGSIVNLDRQRVPSDGYVVSTLEASVWCLAHGKSFAESVLLAVNLGGDTDTTGAVTGGMAGWLLGAKSIPETWLDALPRRQEVDALIGKFTERCLDHWSSDGTH